MIMKGLAKSFKLIRQKLISNKKTITISLIAFVLFILMFIESGFALYSTISQRAKIFILIGTFALTFILLGFLFDYKSFIDNIKKIPAFFKDQKNKIKGLSSICKTVSMEFYITFFFSLLIVLSLAFNNEKSSNLNGYLMLLSVVILSYFLSKLFSLKQYAKAFTKIMLIICTVSCIINLFYLVSGNDLANAIASTDTGSSRISSFFFLFINNISNNSRRMAGPFWEPGVFASMLLFAIVLYHFFVNREKLLVPLCFSIGVLFTQSAAGILILFVTWSIVLIDYLRNDKLKFGIELALIFFFLFIIIAIYSPAVFDVFYNLMPSLFSKFRSVSLTSRYYSLIYGFKIFFTSPLFGLGTSSARETFFSMTAADGITVDAFTSTLGTLVAGYGIVGLLLYCLPLVGLACSRGLDPTLKILLGIFFFLLTLQESQIEIFTLFIFYIMFGFDQIKARISKTQNNKVFDFSDDKKCVLNIFFQKTEKGNVSSNIAINTLVKGLTLLIGFVTISIYSSYFGNKNAYGVWLSIISLSTWILQLDFGFGNSLRNKLTEAIVQNDRNKERAILSSTYAVTFAMTIVWIIISIVLCNTLDLFEIFKASEDYISESVLKASILIILISIAIELSLRNVTYILQVIGKSGLASSLTLISNVLILIFACVVKIDGDSKFLFLAIVYSVSILLPLIVASFVVFTKKVIPFISVKSITKESLISVSKMGAGFFVVQLSNLFLWSLNDILLINLLNRPDIVVDYTEYYKIFTAITSLAMILQGPVWVGISAAKEQRNLVKLKKYSNINLVFSAFLALCSLILTFALPFVFNIWLGATDSPAVTPAYQIVMLAFAFVTCGYEYFGLICNGLGILKPQAIVACVAVVLKIPLVLLLNYCFGEVLSWSSVVLANTILLSIYLVVLPISIKKDIQKIKQTPTPASNKGVTK